MWELKKKIPCYDKFWDIGEIAGGKIECQEYTVDFQLIWTLPIQVLVPGFGQIIIKLNQITD